MSDSIELTDEQKRVLQHGTVTAGLMRSVFAVTVAKLEKDIAAIDRRVIQAPNNTKRLMQEKSAMNIGLMTVVTLSQAFEVTLFEAVKRMGENDGG